MIRLARVVAMVLGALLAVGCSSPAGLTPAALPGEPIVVIGDSYTMGPENNGEDPDAWPAMVWDHLRDSGYQIQPTVSGEGGSGYAHRGYRGGVFGDKAGAVQPDTDLVVIFGSANDMDVPTDVERTAVRELLTGVRLVAPKARLLILGPAWPRADVPPEVWGVRDIVRDEAARVGATFVDPLAERWLWDDPNLIGADWIHPNLAGQQYLARKILPLIQAALPAPGKA